MLVGQLVRAWWGIAMNHGSTVEMARVLVTTGALRFGSFTTKSGRESPFFMNFGAINGGAELATLAGWYADAIIAVHKPLPDIIFGPAYKGIPLAVAVASELARKTGAEVGFAFDRKEPKTHGEGGMVIGRPLENGRRVLIVDDVLTAGTSVGQTLSWMQDLDVEIVGVLVGVDRCEKASDALGGVGSASSALARMHQIRVDALTDVKKIMDAISAEKGLTSESGLTESIRVKVNDYLARFGA
jgi:orotate phosphoribosyltransferase